MMTKKKKKKKGLSATMIKEIKKSRLSDEALAVMYRVSEDDIRQARGELYGHEAHCNVLHPAAECVCDCKRGRQ